MLAVIGRGIGVATSESRHVRGLCGKVQNIREQKTVTRFSGAGERQEPGGLCARTLRNWRGKFASAGVGQSGQQESFGTQLGLESGMSRPIPKRTDKFPRVGRVFQRDVPQRRALKKFEHQRDCAGTRCRRSGEALERTGSRSCSLR
jgi:hypothetical protein